MKTTSNSTKLKQLYKIAAAIVLLLLSNTLYGQIKPPSYEVGFSSVISEGDQAPFWLISNRQGKYLPDRYASSMEFGIFAEPDTGKVFDYGYGLDFYGRVSDNNFDGMLNQTFGGNGNFWLHQAYAQFVLYDFVQLRGGMWEEIVGSREPNLSSGSIIWSGNARPIPKIEISSPGYLPVPYTQGYAEIKGLLSHGWLEEGRFASDVWLHHKNAYIRLGGDLPVNIHYGFNHYALWGGSSPLQDVPYPSDLNAYLRVFFNKSSDPDEEGAPGGWVENKEGNTLGSRNKGIDLDLDNLSAGIYLQDVFEDWSGLTRKNFPDGLWGAYIRLPEEKRPVQAAVYEYLQTTDQSGPVHCMERGLVGDDNYFNHGHYKSGWTYHKYTIGTPLITSTIFNDSDNHRIVNNRVKAHHLGLEGFITNEIEYRSLLTYSKNYGLHRAPLNEDETPLNQFSFMLELTRPLAFFDMEAGVTLAADVGEMYGDNFGVFVTMRRTGVLER